VDSPSWIGRAAWRVALGAALLAVVWGAYKTRRQLIRSWFSHGQGGAPPPALGLPSPMPVPAGLAETQRVRVVLMDGVGARTSRGMANYDKVCASGLDLSVDVGFPTVSLPIQHVLWTGLTQQQTGVMYSNARIKTPRGDTIPARVPHSRAVSEAYQRIAMSVGFRRVDPTDAKRVDPHWSLSSSWRRWLSAERSGEFERVAIQAVGGDARLVFVHILRTDSIAHKVGTESFQYAEAAAWADRLLGKLIEEDNSAHPHLAARWFVLSDHGHRSVGGHGGAEASIRTIRACVSGSEHMSGDIHLVDLSRAIADSLGITLSPRSAGRPVFAAMARPEPGKTLPRPGPLRWLLALLLIIFGMAIAFVSARAWWYWPLWLPLAYLSLIAIEATPTLSTLIVYNSFSKQVYWAIVPGLMVLAICSALILRMDRAWRVLATQLVPAAGFTLAALVLCGGEHHLVNRGGPAALMPVWSGHASVFLAVFYVAAFVVALALVIGATFRPSSAGSAPANDASD